MHPSIPDVTVFSVKCTHGNDRAHPAAWLNNSSTATCTWVHCKARQPPVVTNSDSWNIPARGWFCCAECARNGNPCHFFVNRVTANANPVMACLRCAGVARLYLVAASANTDEQIAAGQRCIDMARTNIIESLIKIPSMIVVTDVASSIMEMLQLMKDERVTSIKDQVAVLRSLLSAYYTSGDNDILVRRILTLEREPRTGTKQCSFCVGYSPVAEMIIRECVNPDCSEKLFLGCTNDCLTRCRDCRK